MFFLSAQTILCGAASSSSSSSSVHYPIDESPTDLFVTSNIIFTTSGRHVHMFNTSLSPIGHFHCSNNILQIVFIDNFTQAVCLYNGSCYFHKGGLQKIEFLETAISEASSSLSFTGGIVYIASFYMKEDTQKTIQIRKFRYDYITSMLKHMATRTLRVTDNNFVSRTFVENFYDGGYVYIVAMDHSSDNSGLKIMRMRHNEEASIGSIYEINIECGAVTSNTSIINISKLKQIVIVRLSGNGEDYFCALNIADVNSQCTQVCEQCLSGSHKYSLPWFNSSMSCNQVSDSNLNTVCIFTFTMYRR